MSDIKPGWKTTEFWLSLLAVILASIVSSGVLGDDSAVSKVVAAIIAGLAALGYSASRGMVKGMSARNDSSK